MRDRVEIPAELVGERADKIVAALAGVSRQTARSLFAQGVLVDAHPVEPDQRIDGTEIEFELPVSVPTLEPEAVPFQVRYEDEHLLVVDKPAGVVVHPGAGRESRTLAAGLLRLYPELEGVGGEFRAGLVHRLDKETSGLLLVARAEEVHARLVKDLAARRIHRQYLALVHGEMEMPTGTIDAPISRDPARPTRQKVSPEGRPSRTHYRVLWQGDGLALLAVDLETGRTHQIRVHLAAIGHPVAGDRTYSRDRSARGLRRMFLHAARLQFRHPVTDIELTVESPLPVELEKALAVHPGAMSSLSDGSAVGFSSI
ncbi:MAG TPA: RluA family pseudouridine synthase [Acidimicrobiia bacterium]|nr:RluA family pseudouridine synthase [Acidimicrobiia bacterium]